MLDDGTLVTAVLQLNAEELLLLRQGGGRTRPIERQLPRRYWRRSAAEPSLLVARPAKGEGSTHIVGVGRLDGGPPIQRGEFRRVVLRSTKVLDRTQPMDAVLEVVNGRSRPYLAKAVGGSEICRPLPRLAGTQLAEALAAVYPATLRMLEALPSPDPIQRRAAEDRARMAVKRDGIWTALSWFGFRPAKAVPDTDVDPLDDIAEGLEARFSESDAITDDAGSFPDWDRDSYSRKGWWQFRKDGRRLLVKNIDKSTQEAKTGADLVYIRSDPDAILLVQYKMLERINDRHGFRPDERFRSQLDRLVRSEGVLNSGRVQTGESSFRLSKSCTFVKFVEPGGVPELPGNLTAGFYMPAEYLNDFLPELLTRGRRGGHYLDVGSLRSIRQGAFAGLVRSGLVGSVGEVTEALAIAVLDQILATDRRDLILALDTP